ncbi:MAG: LLM class flavin-dependent oxidoreductase [Sporichthyaceae bacterium]
MRLGVIVLPEQRWADAQHRWRKLDEWGFHSAWTYDHLSWRSLADGPWFATVPTLTAAALVTRQIRLGTFVASPNYRHPVPFAKELMSLDDVSNGRFVLGVGAGGTGFDASVLGTGELSAGERVSRFAEFVELLDSLLTKPITSYDGTWFRAIGARMVPGCAQQPRLPFVVAANGPSAMRVAAVHGQAWVTTGVTPPEDGEERWWSGVANANSRMDAALESVGREPADLARYLSLDASGVFALSSLEQSRDAVGRAESMGFAEVVVHWPRPGGVYAGDEGVLEEVASELLPELHVDA